MSWETRVVDTLQEILVVLKRIEERQAKESRDLVAAINETLPLNESASDAVSRFTAAKLLRDRGGRE